MSSSRVNSRGVSAKQAIALSLPSIHPSQPQTAAFQETGTGTPLLMLHGFMGSAACWVPLMATLSSEMRCVALDLLGFGDSAKPRMRYNIAQEVAFVREFVQAQNLGACYLLGHSFGGWVAAAYAIAHPDLVKGVILAAPAGIRDDSFCGRYDHLRPILWETPVVDWILTAIAPVLNRTNQRDTLKKIRWMRQELMAQPAARSFLMDRLRPEDAIDTVECEIHRIQAPTLVITGDRDDTIPLWHCETYAHRIPNAKLVILPDADHSLPRDYAPQLATHIQSFLATHALV